MNRSLIKHIGLLLIGLIPAGLLGCGGGGGGAGTASITVSQVTVTPSLLALPKGSVQQFSAKDQAGNPVPVTWSLTYPVATSTGAIDPSGLYHAPVSLPDDNFVTVQATSTSDSTKTGSVSFFLTTGTSLTFQNPADITTVINLHGPPLGLRMASSKGKVYLTWVASAVAGGSTLWYSVGDKSGSLSPPIDILSDLASQIIFPYSSASTQNPNNPAIATDGAHIFISWDDNITGNYQVYLARGQAAICSSSPCFSPFAATIGGPSLLAEGDSSVSQHDPSISIGLKGNLEMVWENIVVSSGRAIRYKEFDALGNQLRLAYAPATTNIINYEYFPRVVSDLSGNISVTWVDFGVPIPGSIIYSSMPLGQTSFNNTYVSMSAIPLTVSDSYSLSMSIPGVPYLAWSYSGGTSTTGIWTAYYSSGPQSFSSPALFRANGLEPILKIDLLNNANLSWYDSPTQSVSFMKGDLGFATTSSYQVSGANPLMDIDEGGRVNLLFTTSNGQNFSTWFTRGE